MPQQGFFCSRHFDYIYGSPGMSWPVQNECENVDPRSDN